jgi:Predicted GTPase
MGIIDELKKHLNNKNRGEILREGYKISIIVKSYYITS